MHPTAPDPRGMSKRGFFKAAAGGVCALAAAGSSALQRGDRPRSARKGLIRPQPSPWFGEVEDGAMLGCELCPRRCRIPPGRRGACRVRENRGGRGYSLGYGTPCLIQLDPVERKPFFHVLPGTRALSVSTAGCNMECRFCEVWDMALVNPEDVHAYDLPPDDVVAQARDARARSISYAFGEPVVFYEYMDAIATRAREAGLLNLLHTNGYIAEAPIRALCDRLDAVNIDLKGFDPAFYREVCGGELAPVLETLKRLAAAGVHLEITHLVIPSLNDDPARIREMCRWIAGELGRDVPLHFARFYPLYKLANLPPTPVRTLDLARAAAIEEGLRYVYIARVTGHEGENTFCPACGAPVVRRLGFVVEEIRLANGRCKACGHPIPGRWE